MATELETIAEKERIASIARNAYKYTDEYSSGHANALATGDDKGKGENAGQIGSLTDINTRTNNLVKNEYSENNGYSSGNKNALSDGDEKGKGETTTIGGTTDINQRKANMTKNERFGITPDKPYNSTHSNALSDGDERGKGQKNDSGDVGSLTDINERKANMVKNERFSITPDNPYNSTHSNALSDGDERGKGQVGDTGDVGTLTDINERKANLGKNDRFGYGPDKKHYPDFVI